MAKHNTVDKLPKVSKTAIKRMALLAVATLLTSAIYFGLIQIGNDQHVYIPVMEVFLGIFAVLIVSLVLVNRGFGNGIYEDPEAYCRAEWSQEQRDAFKASLPKRKSAKIALTIWIFAVLVPLGLDMILLLLGI